MSSSYYLGAGYIKFDGEPIVTPIVECLLGPFKLQKSTGEEDAYHIHFEEEATWGSLSIYFTENSDKFGDLGLVSNELPESTYEWLSLLSKKLNNKDFAYSEEEFDDDEPIRFGTVYSLINELNDGHNVASISMECAWYGDKVIAGEVGGGTLYYSKVLNHNSDSGETKMHVETISSCLSQGKTNGAALALRRVLNNFTEGMSSDDRLSVLSDLQVLLENQIAEELLENGNKKKSRRVVP